MNTQLALIVVAVISGSTLVVTVFNALFLVLLVKAVIG